MNIGECGHPVDENEDICDDCQPKMTDHIGKDEIDAAIALLKSTDMYAVKDLETSEWL